MKDTFLLYHGTNRLFNPGDVLAPFGDNNTGINAVFGATHPLAAIRYALCKNYGARKCFYSSLLKSFFLHPVSNKNRTPAGYVYTMHPDTFIKSPKHNGDIYISNIPAKIKKLVLTISPEYFKENGDSLYNIENWELFDSMAIAAEKERLLIFKRHVGASICRLL